MAEEGAKKGPREGRAGKAERKAKRKEARGKKSGSERERNPVLELARTQYAEKLRKDGIPQDQVREKVKAHMKGVVRPAMTEAKTSAKSKNLKGPERKKFIQDSVRSKLNLQA